MTYYQEGVILQAEVDGIATMPKLTVSAVRDNLRQQKSEVTKYQVKTMDYADDEWLAPLRQTLQDSVNTQSLRLAAELELSEATRDKADDPKAAPTSIVSHSELKIDLPPFSGKPTDWHDFMDLFAATMKKRGSHLSNPEKCCLLLKAMSTEEAKSVVNKYKTGDEGYEAAVKALEEAYGHPKYIYPIHVKTLMKEDHYTYSRSGLRRMREMTESILRGMSSVKGDTFEHLVAAILMERFDDNMKHEWTTHIATTRDKELPTMMNIIEFFWEREINLDEDDEHKVPRSRLKPLLSKPSPVRTLKPLHQSTVPSPMPKKCLWCPESHTMLRCPKFQNTTPAKRHTMVKEARHCTNCLGLHSWSECTSTFTCRRCSKKHHTMLHREPSNDVVTPTNTFAPSPPAKILDAALLPTALVEVANGPRSQKGRLLFDSGASVSLMTESMASHLCLQRHSANLHVDGINGDSRIKHYVHATLSSLYYPDRNINVKFYVIKKIPATISPKNPKAMLKDPPWCNLVEMADPALGGHVDILVSSVVSSDCFTGPSKTSRLDRIWATPTLFGWTIVGPLDDDEAQPVFRFQQREDTLQKSLESLWNKEQVPNETPLKDEDQMALEHFADTHTRKEDGRYEVKLPRVQDPPELGNSQNMAIRRFHQNERSLRKKGLLDQFNQVVNEYVDLGHAEPVQEDKSDKTENTCYYLPTQGVIREASTTTKLSAVFDASAKTMNRVSLNDTLPAGPTLHPMLPDILLKFRFHKVACTADIGKMFREISLHKDERNFYRFLRRREDNQVETCHMTRLTFGVRSSPFIATRVICHLAETNAATHPVASEAILTCFYVDDCPRSKGWIWRLPQQQP